MAKTAGSIAGDKKGNRVQERKGQQGVAPCYLHLAGALSLFHELSVQMK